MFYLDPRATFQGYTEDGMAIFAVSKPEPIPAPRATLDEDKLAKAHADRAYVQSLLGDQN